MKLRPLQQLRKLLLDFPDMVGCCPFLFNSSVQTCCWSEKNQPLTPRREGWDISVSLPVWKWTWDKKTKQTNKKYMTAH